MKRCKDCGCRVNMAGVCDNCDEEVFIAEQYNDLGMVLPDEDSEFMRKLRKSNDKKK